MIVGSGWAVDRCGVEDRMLWMERAVGWWVGWRPLSRIWMHKKKLPEDGYICRRRGEVV